MSSPSGSNKARDRWIILNKKLLKNLGYVYPFKKTISSELQFRDEFWALPEPFNTASIDRNYGLFLRYHGQILYIIRTLDEALALESPNSLNDVFYTYALAALQAAARRGYDFYDPSDLYPKLNDTDCIPAVSSDLPQFPENVLVQEPLQNIFEIYIECYLVFVTQYASLTERKRFDRQAILDKTAAAGPRYKEAEDQWRTRLQQAIDDQKDTTKDVPGTETTTDNFVNRDPRFEHRRPLGRGAYGTVDEVREVTTNSVYARKSIPRRIPGQDMDGIERRVINEVAIMSRLRHNHIASVNILFKDEQFWSMIMLPVADCDLRGFLDDRCVRAGFPREEMRMIDPWFGCLISALAYAHAERIKHEDIKPNNILIKGKKIFLTDFGTAKDFSLLERSTVSDYFQAGTPIYWAPESRPWGRAADVFALGCVFSEMLTVRQRKTLQEYRDFRYNEDTDFGYAFRANLPRVADWLKNQLGINTRDPAGQAVLEQTLNMLIEAQDQRSEAIRVKKMLKAEDVLLFCATCV